MGKSRDLSEFERGMIVGARRAGYSISETVNSLGFSKTTVSRVYREWRQQEKTSSNRGLAGRKRLVDETGERRMERVVEANSYATCVQIQALYNSGGDSDRPISLRTTRRTLKRLGYSRKNPRRNALPLPEAEQPSSPSLSFDCSGQTELGPTVRGNQTELDPTVRGNQTELDPTVRGNQTELGPTVRGNQTELDPTVCGNQTELGPTVRGNQTELGPTVRGNQTELGPTVRGNQNELGPTVRGNQTELGPTVRGNQNELDPTVCRNQSELDSSFCKNQ